MAPKKKTSAPAHAFDHIVHVMLENRSFDQMLGFLYEGKRTPNGQAFEGLTGSEYNLDDTGRKITVFKIDATLPHPYLMPGADPGEGFSNTNLQLFETDDPAANAAPANSGFVINFKRAIAYDSSKNYKDSLPDVQPQDIMGMYTPQMLPVLSALAKSYAVCDMWFSSAPTMTLPNRSFALAGTSQGHLSDTVHSFTCPSIFGRLTDAKQPWAIYGYNRDPMTRLDYNDVKTADDSHFGHFGDFQAAAKAGDLPAYTFLEPEWSATGNSQHPNYDVALGEQFLSDIYNAVRTSPVWNRTLLIVTYDEHGGNFDHVSPPYGATPPDDSLGDDGFDFKRFGLRVPAVLISPLIAPGSVFRMPGKVIDHTSVLATIHKRFGTNVLTKRDAAAPSLESALTLKTPRTDNALTGVVVPVSQETHPNSSVPAKLEKLHVAKVAQLPTRTDKGVYAPSDAQPLTSSAQIGEYIEGHTAAWSQHLQRRRQRRAAHTRRPET